MLKESNYLLPYTESQVFIFILLHCTVFVLLQENFLKVFLKIGNVLLLVLGINIDVS